MEIIDYTTGVINTHSTLWWSIWRKENMFWVVFYPASSVALKRRSIRYFFWDSLRLVNVEIVILSVPLWSLIVSYITNSEEIQELETLATLFSASYHQTNMVQTKAHHQPTHTTTRTVVTPWGHTRNQWTALPVHLRPDHNNRHPQQCGLLQGITWYRRLNVAVSMVTFMTKWTDCYCSKYFIILVQFS